jgi:hypothetical protein
MKSFVAYLLGTFLFLAAANASTIWTSVGSTGTIPAADVAAVKISGPTVTYSSTSTMTGGIAILYNVTSDSTALPGWTTFEMVGSNDDTNNGLYAYVYAVSRTTGARTPLVTATAGPIAGTTVITGTMPTGYVFDFTNYYYYAVVNLVRSTTTVQPSITGLRIY